MSSVDLQQLLRDVVQQLSKEERIWFREFVQELKAKRDAGEIPSLSEALLRDGFGVVGAAVWWRAFECQRGREAETSHSKFSRSRGDMLRRLPAEMLEVVASFLPSWPNYNGLFALRCACTAGRAAVRRAVTTLDLVHAESVGIKIKPEMIVAVARDFYELRELSLPEEWKCGGSEFYANLYRARPELTNIKLSPDSKPAPMPT